MKGLILAAPVAACAAAVAEAALSGLSSVLSPWDYAAASIVVSTAARVLTRNAFIGDVDSEEHDA
jgi:fructose-1,6-bisphosphatase/inositol monophosphatase family enzyme